MAAAASVSEALARGRAATARERVALAAARRRAAAGRGARRRTAPSSSARPSASSTADEAARFDGFLRRREAREPVAYIRGRRAFRTHRARGDARRAHPAPGDRDARRRRAGGARRRRGRGAARAARPRRRHRLGLHRPGAGGRAPVRRASTAVDIDEAAVEVARRNAARLGLGGRVRHPARATSSTACRRSERFDLIVSNPPYVPAAEYDDARAQRARLRAAPRAARRRGRARRLSPAHPRGAGAPAARRGAGASRSARGEAADVRALFAAAGGYGAAARARRPRRHPARRLRRAKAALTMRSEKVRAVVLARVPLGEADRILRLFTRELGPRRRRRQGRAQDDVALGRPPGAVQRLRPGAVPGPLAVHGHAGAARGRLPAAARGPRGADRGGGDLRGRRRPRPRARARGARVRAPAQRAQGARRRLRGPAVQAPLVLGALLKLLYEAGYMPVLDHCASLRRGRARARVLRRARRSRLRRLPRRTTCRSRPRRSRRCATRWRGRWPSSAPRRRRRPRQEALRDVHDLYGYHTGARCARCASRAPPADGAGLAARARAGL